MIVNKKKSGIIYHRVRSKKIKKKKMYHGYPIVSEYKYLGVIIDSKLSFKQHIEQMRKKIYKKALKFLKALKLDF